MFKILTKYKNPCKSILQGFFILYKNYLPTLQFRGYGLSNFLL